jgi:alpha-beta hydrolase superfamily lysophospholipase
LTSALVALIAVLIVEAWSAPRTDPWHSETLTEEFTAERADEIAGFEDYLELEERVFAELDEKVYAEVKTGPDFALFRYSAGSAADPRGRDPDWNRSFDWPVEDAKGGVLLLHGLTDSPYSLRALALTLNAHGYRVLGLRLPGHGTAPSGLVTLKWQDMAAAARIAMAHLASALGGKPVHIVGYSTGAALALNFTLDALAGTASPVPASLVLVSPAIGVSPAAALAGAKANLARVPGLRGLGWLQIVPEFDPYKYNSFPTNGGAQVHDLTSWVTQRLRTWAQDPGPEPFPPTLVLKSAVDATVSTDAVVDRLLSLLPPDRNEIVLFDVNRFAVKSGLMLDDPAPFTDRLLEDDALPFEVTFVTNAHRDSRDVVARRKTPFSNAPSPGESLGMAWPRGYISLSHVALPIPPDDPLYGQGPPPSADALFLGDIALRGERGLLKFPEDWLMRVRHNPFYGFLEAQALDWIESANRDAR